MRATNEIIKMEKRSFDEIVSLLRMIILMPYGKSRLSFPKHAWQVRASSVQLIGMRLYFPDIFIDFDCLFDCLESDTRNDGTRVREKNKTIKQVKASINTFRRNSFMIFYMQTEGC